MTTAWMVYTIAISCLLGAAAFALECACRLRRWPSRWIWALTLAAPFVLPFAASVQDESASREEAPVLAISLQNVATADPPSVESVVAPAAQVAQHAHRLMTSPGVVSLLIMLWFGGSMLLALGLLDSWRRIQKKSTAWTRRCLDGVDVLVSDDTGPAVIGFLRPRIVLPTWLCAADAQVRSLAIAHESEHVRARDPLLLLLGTLAVVLLPWNLPLWWQWRRLRFAIEVDCDARVLASGRIAELTYAEALLNVAERSSRLPFAAAAMCESPSTLERRIGLFLRDRSAHQRIVALLLLVAGVGVAAAATQIDAPAAVTVEAQQSQVKRALGRQLVEAIQEGARDAAVALINAGADVDQAVPRDGSPLIAAARQQDSSLAQMLLERGAQVDLEVLGDGNPLIAASKVGNLEIVRTLVEHGADVNGFVLGDETPLINAARAGHLDVVRYLVAQGADVNLAVPAESGPGAEIRSPLGEALKHNQVSVVEYLRAQGAAAR